MVKNEIAKNLILQEIKNAAGDVFADYWVRFSNDDKAKKSLEAMDFMNNLLNGKPIKKDWKIEETENYSRMVNLLESYKLLQ